MALKTPLPQGGTGIQVRSLPKLEANQVARAAQAARLNAIPSTLETVLRGTEAVSKNLLRLKQQEQELALEREKTKQAQENLDRNYDLALRQEKRLQKKAKADADYRQKKLEFQKQKYKIQQSANSEYAKILRKQNLEKQKTLRAGASLIQELNLERELNQSEANLEQMLLSSGKLAAIEDDFLKGSLYTDSSRDDITNDSIEDLNSILNILFPDKTSLKMDAFAAKMINQHPQMKEKLIRMLQDEDFLSQAQNIGAFGTVALNRMNIAKDAFSLSKNNPNFRNPVDAVDEAINMRNPQMGVGGFDYNNIPINDSEVENTTTNFISEEDRLKFSEIGKKLNVK